MLDIGNRLFELRNHLPSRDVNQPVTFQRTILGILILEYIRSQHIKKLGIVREYDFLNFESVLHGSLVHIPQLLGNCALEIFQQITYTEKETITRARNGVVDYEYTVSEFFARIELLNT
jgi:hypothetical protein